AGDYLAGSAVEERIDRKQHSVSVDGFEGWTKIGCFSDAHSAQRHTVASRRVLSILQLGLNLPKAYVDHQRHPFDVRYERSKQIDLFLKKGSPGIESSAGEIGFGSVDTLDHSRAHWIETTGEYYRDRRSGALRRDPCPTARDNHRYATCH